MSNARVPPLIPSAMQASDRLELVLDYLRRRYAYCFWCGTEYEDQDDMPNSETEGGPMTLSYRMRNIFSSIAM